MLKVVNFKNICLMFAISFTIIGNSVFASDNVLQAIQIDGTKDSYNIILRSDDTAVLKKTIQAPNKMILDLKGIRVSKTINTIYNNTSSVDSIVVEPTGNDSVKILIQASNVANAAVHFDTLKTPLGVLGNQKNKTQIDELVLNNPIESYTPVYKEPQVEEEPVSMAGGAVISGIKGILKNEKTGWMLTFGLLAMFILSGIKNIKGKDSDIRVGLTQSMRDREINMHRGADDLPMSAPSSVSNITLAQGMSAGANYGLRAYQNGSRSPYSNPEVQNLRPRPVSTPVASSQPVLNRGVNPTLTKPAQGAMQATIQNTIQNVALKPASTNKKTANIDSIKFLESMTKIYEKNGRTDLAQGLKANMKKAKGSLA